MNIAINGFGRVGRLAFRILLLNHADQFENLVINTSGSMPVSGWAHLVNYDTTYRKFAKQVNFEELKKPADVTDQDSLIGYLIVDNRKFPVLAQRDPAKLPWTDHQIDVVIESTGVFTDPEGAGKHLTAGAKRVVLSAPAKSDQIHTYVLGVNEIPTDPTNPTDPTPEAIISNASCTTNCISPVAEIIHSKFGVSKAFMTTIHSYTDDQNLQDASHKDLRRARAAAMNMIPTTTGAAIATTEVIPELKGLFDGISIRVPTITGSLANLFFITKKPVTVDQINTALEEASTTSRFQNILSVSHLPLVSSDIIGSSYSAIVDAEFTRVIDHDLVSILAWYDNEWGYTTRLVEQTIQLI